MLALAWTPAFAMVAALCQDVVGLLLSSKNAEPFWDCLKTPGNGVFLTVHRCSLSFDDACFLPEATNFLWNSTVIYCLVFMRTWAWCGILAYSGEICHPLRNKAEPC